MPYLKVSSVLQLTAGTVGLELAFFAILLMRRRLFRWTTAGFWAWVAFLLYFVLSPWAVSVSDFPLYRAGLILELTGGTERAIWILLMTVSGIAMYFIAYLMTSFKPVTWNLPIGPLQLNPPLFLILSAFVAFGMYSLLVFRADLFSTAGEKLIVNGKFVGDVTGYQNVGYTFLFVPIFLLFFSEKRKYQILGWIAAVVFLILSLPHAWSRFATVSFLLALSLISVIKGAKRWPSVIWVVGIVLIAVLYQVRGHSNWHFGQINSEFVNLVDSLPSHTNQIFSSNDTSMLLTWYVSSHLSDRWDGFDYGLPILNYALAGWIPSRILPNKYFMIDWLVSQRNNTHPVIFDQLLYGAKSSLFGSFYGNGGLIGVLIGCLLAGYLSRRIDGMLVEENSSLVKSVAVAWLSVLWMVWGSGTPWALMVMGTLVIPALAFRLFLLKVSSKQFSQSQSLELQSNRANLLKM